MNRQARRVAERSKDKELRARVAMEAELMKPEMRLAHLESVVFNHLVPDFKTLVEELRRRKVLEVKTETGLLLP